MIEIEVNGQVFRFPAGTSQDVMRQAIDRQLGVSRQAPPQQQVQPIQAQPTQAQPVVIGTFADNGRIMRGAAGGAIEGGIYGYGEGTGDERAHNAGDTAAATRLAQMAREAQTDLIPEGYDGPTPPGGFASLPVNQPGYAATAPESGNFERTQRMAAPGFEAAGQFAQTFKPGNPSIIAESIPSEIPLYGENGPSVPIPDIAAQIVGRIGDFAMIPMSALGGVTGGAAGLVGDAADAAGMSDGNADRLTRDLAAVPEAFAGSPTVFGSPMRPGAGANPRPAPRPDAPASQDPAAVGQMVRNAANREREDAATKRLADNMNINVEDMQAAQRLGMNLPSDVFSDNTAVRQSAGLSRSLAGSEPEAQFRDAVTAASRKADEAMQSINGSTDISLLSESVRTSLRTARDGLEAEAKVLYDAVDASIPRTTQIEPNNMVNAVNRVLTELGGEGGLTPQERALFNLVTGDQPITYARLLREKRLIGQALERRSGPYADADEAALRSVYGAMVEDQLANVERIAGADVRGNLEAANFLHGQRMDLQKQIVSAFGRDGEGSMAQTLRLAVTRASGGDVSNLNRAMAIVPMELRAEALATAIASVSTSRRAAAPGFDFAAFTKTYEGLRRNSQVYDRVSTTLGPDATRLLSDLSTVSRRITDARAAVIPTGKANQALVQSMTAEGIMSRVMDTTVGRGTVRTAAAGAGASTGGLVGAVGGASIGESIIKGLTRGDTARVNAAGRMFNSPEFNRLVTEAATDRVSQEAIDALADSGAYRAWARQTNVPNPGPWIAATVLAAQQDERAEQE